MPVTLGVHVKLLIVIALVSTLVSCFLLYVSLRNTQLSFFSSERRGDNIKDLSISSVIEVPLNTVIRIPINTTITITENNYTIVIPLNDTIDIQLNTTIRAPLNLKIDVPKEFVSNQDDERIQFALTISTLAVSLVVLILIIIFRLKWSPTGAVVSGF